MYHQLSFFSIPKYLRPLQNHPTGKKYDGGKLRVERGLGIDQLRFKILFFELYKTHDHVNTLLELLPGLGRAWVLRPPEPKLRCLLGVTPIAGLCF